MKHNLNNKLSATCAVLFGIIHFFVVLNYDCKVHTNHIHQGEHQQTKKNIRASKPLNPHYFYILCVRRSNQEFMWFFCAVFFNEWDFKNWDKKKYVMSINVWCGWWLEWFMARC